VLPTWRRMRHHTPNMQHGERGCPGGWWGAEGGGGRLLWVVRAGGCAATVCIQKRGATAAGTGSKNRSRSSWRREFEIRKLLSTNAEYLCECVAVAVWVCACTKGLCVGDCLAMADETHQLAAVARCVRFRWAPNSELRVLFWAPNTRPSCPRKIFKVRSVVAAVVSCWLFNNSPASGN